MLTYCLCLTIQITPIKDVVVGGGGSPIGAFNPHGSIVIVMKTSSTFATSFLKWASFRRTTFQPGFLKFFRKKTCVTWLGNMKGSDVNGSLCQKFRMRNPTSSCTYVGFPRLFSRWIHSHLKTTIGACIGP